MLLIRSLSRCLPPLRLGLCLAIKFLLAFVLPLLLSESLSNSWPMSCRFLPQLPSFSVFVLRTI